MRFLVLLLAVAISPLTLTVCEWTCAFPAAAVEQAATPSCHEDMDTPSGPAVEASTPCQHDRALSRLQLAKQSAPFALVVAFDPEPALSAPAMVPVRATFQTRASTWLPPPRISPLRI